ncbi:MAG: glycoside hydrolase family 19 protein [candidate division KSB1 bacterium]
MPKLPDAKRTAFLPPLQSAMNEFAVNTPKREAAFLAQIAHESGELTIFAENLNYSANGLMATWPKRFPDLATAQKYERNPEKLANYVYASRVGNGNEASGDGWKFRGRGPIQITGRENYQKYGSRLNVDLINNADRAAAPEVGFRVAGLYWKENGLNELADSEMFETITKRINGGLKGLEERKHYYARAKTVLGVPISRGMAMPESEQDIELAPEFTRGQEAQEDSAPRAKKARKASKKKSKRAPAKPAKKKVVKKKVTKKKPVGGKKSAPTKAKIVTPRSKK